MSKQEGFFRDPSDAPGFFAFFTQGATVSWYLSGTQFSPSYKKWLASSSCCFGRACQSRCGSFQL